MLVAAGDPAEPLKQVVLHQIRAPQLQLLVTLPAVMEFVFLLEGQDNETI